MLLWDVSFSLGAVQLSPQWDHTLVLVSPNLCYDIRFQVTFSRLVSLCQMLFGTVWLPPICLCFLLSISLEQLGDFSR